MTDGVTDSCGKKQYIIVPLLVAAPRRSPRRSPRVMTFVNTHPLRAGNCNPMRAKLIIRIYYSFVWKFNKAFPFVAGECEREGERERGTDACFCTGLHHLVFILDDKVPSQGEIVCREFESFENHRVQHQSMRETTF